MTTTHRRPAEVLLNISIRVENPFRFYCMSVCKNWQQNAIQASYEEMTLQANQIRKIKSIFETNSTDQLKYLDKLNWTKTLIIKDEKEESLLSRYSRKGRSALYDTRYRRRDFEQQEFLTFYDKFTGN